MKIRLISEQYIKENSPLSINVQMKDVFPHIDIAQDTNLAQILGSDFLESIKTKFNNQSLNPDEITLVNDYIKPALLWRSLSLSLPFIHYNIRNKGLIQNTDEAGVSSDIVAYKLLNSTLTERAETYETLLLKFLCKNSSLYPDFKQQSGLTPPSDDDAYDFGILLY